MGYPCADLDRDDVTIQLATLLELRNEEGKKGREETEITFSLLFRYTVLSKLVSPIIYFLDDLIEHR